MIYDCFSFFNELDLLEIRLATLDRVVDRFVISESNFTHRGIPKPLYYKDNESRFAKFRSKIIHVVSPDPEDPERARSDVEYGWVCENRQRNATIRAIEKELRDDDILIVSDLDEIPDPQSVLKAAKCNRPVRLRQKLYCFFLNYRCCTTPYWYTGSVVLPYSVFRDPSTYRNLRKGPAFDSRENAAPSATKVRALLGIPLAPHGGWHFSYIGGIEKVVTKIQSIVDGREARFTDEARIRKCIETGNDPYDRGEWYFGEKVDRSFPSAVKDYSDMIFNVTPDYLRRVRLKRILAYLKGAVRPLAWKIIPHPLAVWLSRRINAH